MTEKEKEELEKAIAKFLKVWHGYSDTVWESQPVAEEVKHG